jgi:hypothetical protein
MPNPSPNDYKPNFTQIERSKFDDISFGFGNRPIVTGGNKWNNNIVPLDTPGPGSYQIKGAFDKFKSPK